MKPYYEGSGVTLYHADIFQSWGHFKSESFDMVFTDPPYWTLDEHRSTGTTTRLGGHQDEDKRSGWFDTIDEKELWEALVEFQRLLKPDRHAYVMGDGQVLRWLLGYSEEASFSHYKSLVWDKVDMGMGYHYRGQCEFIVMYDKGKNRKLNDLGISDLLKAQVVKGGYPTEKPVALPSIPIKCSTQPGELVFDPFCGGGSTLIAAKRLGRKAVGVDKSEQACEITARRLQEMDGDLFAAGRDAE